MERRHGFLRVDSPSLVTSSDPMADKTRDRSAAQGTGAVNKTVETPTTFLPAPTTYPDQGWQDTVSELTDIVMQLSTEMKSMAMRLNRTDGLGPMSSTPLQPRCSPPLRDDVGYEPLPGSNVPASHTASVKPATFDGSTPWQDYMMHFECCASLNKWTDFQKGQHLAVSLRGPAQQVLAGLNGRPGEVHYSSLLSALERRFTPANQTDLYKAQLKSRRRQKDEGLPELGHTLLRLSQLAYPNADEALQNTLASGQFLEALSGDLKYAVWQRHPKSIDEAVHAAVEVEAFHISHQGNPYHTARTAYEKEEPGTMSQSAPDETQSIDKVLGLLQELIKRDERRESSKQQQMSLRKEDGFDCWLCGSPDHFKRDCPRRKTRSGGRGSQTESAHNAGETGIYLPIKIGPINCLCCIDTGASVSILSRRVFDKLPQAVKLVLNDPPVGSVRVADGTDMPLLGEGEFKFDVGGQILRQNMVVANLSIDAILGYNFLSKHQCLIDAESHDFVTAHYAVGASIVVVSVEYRLAPEHPFPTPLIDCVKATAYFINNANRYNVDPQSVAIGGDSAGGNLAAAVSLVLRDAKFQPMPIAQVLIYPVLQLMDLNLPSYVTARRYMNANSMMAMFIGMYMGLEEKYIHVIDQNRHIVPEIRKKYGRFLKIEVLPRGFILANYKRTDPNNWDKRVPLQLGKMLVHRYMSPLLAKDLTKLPEAFIFTAGADFLRDEGPMYAQRLAVAGVKVTWSDFSNAFHGCISITGGILRTETGRQANAAIINFLKETLWTNLYVSFYKDLFCNGFIALCCLMSWFLNMCR